MTRAAWAEVRMEKACKRWVNSKQINGWLSPFANELTKEHKRAVNVVKALKKQSMLNQFTHDSSEKRMYLMALDEALAALQKGRT